MRIEKLMEIEEESCIGRWLMDWAVHSKGIRSGGPGLKENNAALVARVLSGETEMQQEKQLQE